MPYEHTYELIIGRGKVMFSADAVKWEDLGNVSDLKLNITTERKQAYSSREGLKKKIDDTVVQIEAKGTLATNDVTSGNLRRFFMGDAVSADNQSSGAVTNELMTAYMGSWLKLAKINTTLLTLGTTDGTFYEESTDFDWDDKWGWIRPTGSNIMENDVLKAQYSYDVVTGDKTTIAGATTQKGHFWFQGKSAKGKDLEIKGYVSLIPNGDIPMIGDEYISFSMDIEFEEHTEYDDLAEVYRREF